MDLPPTSYPPTPRISPHLPVPHCAGLDCALSPLTPTPKYMPPPHPTSHMNQVRVKRNAAGMFSRALR